MTAGGTSDNFVAECRAAQILRLVANQPIIPAAAKILDEIRAGFASL